MWRRKANFVVEYGRRRPRLASNAHLVLPVVIMTDTDPHAGQNFGNFLIHADQMVREARFVLESLPNVESFAVERSLRQLTAARRVLQQSNDPWLDRTEVEDLLSLVDNLIRPLSEFLVTPPPPQNLGTQTEPSGGGRPRYVLDLEDALRLHDLGNSWEDVSHAFGVSRVTMYRHLQ
ncbi:Integrase catalytic domain-containing protein [Mycena indigotica]|uniref:Integrase catalytic domain-containing protein n=1 Tax=Mycena indigotica TaxID=2126181 RepID=A0A8H6WCS6_9AGAR|nr:Integrase catalytic domain-containing protein [Mycena indigotica]KAF7311731.1 Integrase catalytic domain-containing protein [Mycena indigotica]